MPKAEGWSRKKVSCPGNGFVRGYAQENVREEEDSRKKERTVEARLSGRGPNSGEITARRRSDKIQIPKTKSREKKQLSDPFQKKGSPVENRKSPLTLPYR